MTEEARIQAASSTKRAASWVLDRATDPGPSKVNTSAPKLKLPQHHDHPQPRLNTHRASAQAPCMTSSIVPHSRAAGPHSAPPRHREDIPSGAHIPPTTRSTAARRTLVRTARSRRPEARSPTMTHGGAPARMHAREQPQPPHRTALAGRSPLHPGPPVLVLAWN